MHERVVKATIAIRVPHTDISTDEELTDEAMSDLSRFIREHGRTVQIDKINVRSIAKQLGDYGL